MSWLNGKKTYIAALLIGVAASLQYLGFPEIAAVIGGMGSALAVAGVGHKITKATLPLLLVCVLLPACGTTGPQEQETRANQVEQRQWGGLFGKYEGGVARAGKRTVKTTAPSGQVDADGNPIMVSVEIDEESAGPLVLNLGTLNANQDQGTQGEQTGSGTQAKTDTATPTTTTDTSLTPPQ